LKNEIYDQNLSLQNINLHLFNLNSDVTTSQL